MYSPVALSTFTLFCDNYQKVFLITTKTPQTPGPHSLVSPAPLVHFLSPFEGPHMGESYSTCPLWLAYVTEHNVLRLTHVAASVRISFLFKAEWYSITRLCRIVFTHHQWLFPPLAVVNNAATNTGVLTNTCWVSALILGKYAEEELLGPGKSVFHFVRNPHGLHHFTYPPAVCKDSNSSTSLLTLVIFFLDNNEYEVVSHYDFDLHFPDD